MLKRLILNALQQWRIRQSGKIPYAELDAVHVSELRTLTDRDQLLENLPRQAVVAEIGVFKGDFSKKILDTTNPVVLHLIDSWDGKAGMQNLELVRQRFAPEISAGKVRLHRQKSIAALQQFPEHYFDWVYLDTDHSYATTAAELALCARVVKPSGFIAGHDYVTGNWNGGVRYGVVEAVNAFCVRENWTFRYLTAETHRHLSFAIQHISKRVKLL
jgi:SAM-dependent methyltransferase